MFIFHRKEISRICMDNIGFIFRARRCFQRTTISLRYSRLHRESSEKRSKRTSYRCRHYSLFFRYVKHVCLPSEKRSLHVHTCSIFRFIRIQMDFDAPAGRPRLFAFSASKKLVSFYNQSTIFRGSIIRDQ